MRRLLLPDPAATGSVTVDVVVVTALVPVTEAARLPLDDVDHDRIRAFRREDDVRRFLTGRAVVADYVRDVLGAPSDRIRLVRRRTPRGEGKPRLAATGDVSGLPDVSISHSGGCVVVAFGYGVDVGVDVEEHAALATAGAAMSVALTGRERAAAPTSAALADVFTAKEAVLKSVGWGFGIDPLAVEVIAGRVVRFDAPQARPVTLHPIAVPGEASATLALTPRRTPDLGSLSEDRGAEAARAVRGSAPPP